MTLRSQRDKLSYYDSAVIVVKVYTPFCCQSWQYCVLNLLHLHIYTNFDICTPSLTD